MTLFREYNKNKTKKVFYNRWTYKKYMTGETYLNVRTYMFVFNSKRYCVELYFMTCKNMVKFKLSLEICFTNLYGNSI